MFISHSFDYCNTTEMDSLSTPALWLGHSSVRKIREKLKRKNNKGSNTLTDIQALANVTAEEYLLNVR